AELMRLTGDSEGAWGIASEAFDRGVRDARLIVVYCRLRARRGDLQGAGAILAQTVGQIKNRDIRSEAAFALGDICDRLGRYDDAFRAFAHGNELMAGDFDPGSYRRGVDALIQAWTPEVARALRGSQSEQPVFVLGMPRSGTSLVEQILDCHPQIAGAGEVNRLQPIVRDLSGGQPLLLAPAQLDQAQLARAAED